MALLNGNIDAEKISFPLKLVVAIVLATVSVVSSILVSSYGLRSDIKDVSQTLYIQNIKLEAREKLDEERNTNINHRIDSVEKAANMAVAEVGELRATLKQKGIAK